MLSDRGVAATGFVPDEALVVEEPKAGIAADLTFAAFRLAREHGVPPPQLAGQVAVSLRFEAGSLVGAVSASGPYVNVRVDPARCAAARSRRHPGPRSIRPAVLRSR